MPTLTAQDYLLSTFDIRVSGSPLPLDAQIHVVAVVVDEDVNLPTMVTLDLTGLPLDGEQIPLLDESLFAIGKEMEVKLGYASQLERLLTGEITGLEPTFTVDQLPSLTVRGYDRRHRLQRGRKTRTFVQQKDSDIASQIASEVGLTAEVEDSAVTHDYVLQANQSDWHFLQERAHRIRYEVIVDNKTLHFRPIANDGNSTLTLTFLDDLLEFYPRLSSMGQVTEIAVQGWDVKTKEAITGSAQAGDEVSIMAGEKTGADLSQSAFGGSIGTVSDRPIQTQAEADQLAQAAFNQHLLSLITGEGRCHGRTDLRAGSVITIAGIGKRFSGDYYVTTARHRYDSSGYYTHFTVRRNAS
jgi:uncharacterized protein